MCIDNLSDKRSQTVNGTEYSFASEWIHKLEEERHWRAYWRQMKLVLPALEHGDSILEIGPGTGFTSNYLRSKGYRVTTLDIDDKKSPDIVANLVEYPFPDTYDHILAFEVFEHIPFDKFSAILPLLKKAFKKNLFFSVPTNYRIWFLAELIIPYFKEVSFCIKAKRRKINAELHFWELEYKQYTSKYLERTLSEAGLTIVNTQKDNLMNFYHLKGTQ